LKPIFQLEGNPNTQTKEWNNISSQKRKTQKGDKNEPPLHFQKQTKNTLAVLKGHAHSKTFEHGKVFGIRGILAKL